MSDHQLSGEELIEALSALTPEQRKMPVDIEGCDCSGPAFGVEVEGDGTIWITRGVEVWNEELSETVWREREKP